MIEGWNEYVTGKILKKRERDGDFIRSVVTKKDINEWTDGAMWQMAH